MEHYFIHEIYNIIWNKIHYVWSVLSLKNIKLIINIVIKYMNIKRIVF